MSDKQFAADKLYFCYINAILPIEIAGSEA